MASNSKQYHGLTLYDVVLHGTPARNLQSLLTVLMGAFKKNKPVRVFGQHLRFFVTGQDEHADRARSLAEQVQKGQETYEETAKVIGIQTGGEPMPPIENGRVGIEMHFAGNKKMADNFQEALAQGVPFKIYVPKNGIRIHGDKNLTERINAHNRKVGRMELTSPEGRAQYHSLQMLDGKTGGGIIRVVLL